MMVNCALLLLLLAAAVVGFCGIGALAAVPELSPALLQKQLAQLGDSTLLLELYVLPTDPQQDASSVNTALEQSLDHLSATNQAIKVGRILATPELLKQWLPPHQQSIAPTVEVPLLLVIREHNIARLYDGPVIGTAVSTYFSQVKSSQVVKKFTKHTKRETVERDETVVVGFFASEQDKAFRDFEKMARVLQEDALFAATFDPKVAKTLNLRTSGAIMMHEPFEKKIFFNEDKDETTKPPSLKELINWFDANKKNMLPKVNARNLFMMFKKWENIVLGVVSTGAADSNRFLSVLHDVAASSTINNVGFAFLVKEEVPDYTAQLGLNAMSLPRLVFANMRTTKQFVFPDDKSLMSKDDISTWIQSVQSGSLAPTVKSAPEPAENNGPVFILTANSFDDAVLKSDKNVFVKFYAPWCHHCKEMAPAFEQLGSHYHNAADTTVRIAELDASANDPKESFHIQGFPTLLFFQRGNPTPLPFTGDRTFEAMQQFIEANKK